MRQGPNLRLLNGSFRGMAPQLGIIWGFEIQGPLLVTPKRGVLGAPSGGKLVGLNPLPR